MKDTYENVGDIDLFPGLIMEEAFEDAQIGETFVCLISDTFARLRFGDRFFYDNGGQAGSFTLPQLDQVRAHHMFLRILNFLFVFPRKICLFDKKKATVILALYNLF